MDFGIGHGEIWIPPPVLLHESAPTGFASPPPPRGGLTRSEFTVARRVLAGYTAREIGALLSRSPRTVESHIEGMKSRLGCGSRAELIAALIALGVEALR